MIWLEGWVGWKDVVFFFQIVILPIKKKVTHVFFVVIFGVIFVRLAFCVWIDLSDLVGRLGWLEGRCVFFVWIFVFF